MTCALLRCQNAAENIGPGASEPRRPRLPLCAEHRDVLDSGTWVIDSEPVDFMNDGARPPTVLTDRNDLDAGDYRTLVCVGQAFQRAMVNGSHGEVLTLSLSHLDGEPDRDVRLVLTPPFAEVLADMFAGVANRQTPAQLDDESQ